MPLCPVCGVEFSRFAINAHVNVCLDVAVGGGEALPALSLQDLRLLGERQRNATRTRSRTSGGTLWVCVDAIAVDRVPRHSSSSMACSVDVRATFEDITGGAVLNAESADAAVPTMRCTSSAEFAFEALEFNAASPLLLDITVAQKGVPGSSLRCTGTIPLGALVSAPPTGPHIALRRVQHGSMADAPLDQWWVRLGGRATSAAASPWPPINEPLVRDASEPGLDCNDKSGDALPIRCLPMCAEWDSVADTVPAPLRVKDWRGVRQPVHDPATARQQPRSPAGGVGRTARQPRDEQSAESAGDGGLEGWFKRCCVSLWPPQVGDSKGPGAGCRQEEASRPALRLTLRAAYVPAIDVAVASGGSPPAPLPVGIHRAVAGGAHALVAALVRSQGPAAVLARTPAVLPDARAEAAGAGVGGGCVLRARLGDLSALDVACLRGDARMVAAFVCVAPPSPRRCFVTGLHTLHCAVLGGSAGAVRGVRLAMAAEHAVLARVAQPLQQQLLQPLPVALPAPPRLHGAALAHGGGGRMRQGAPHPAPVAAPPSSVSVEGVLHALEARYSSRSLATESEAWEAAPAGIAVRQRIAARGGGGFAGGVGPAGLALLPPPERVGRVQRDLRRMVDAWAAQSEAAWVACVAAELAEGGQLAPPPTGGAAAPDLSCCCRSAAYLAGFIRALRPSSQARAQALPLAPREEQSAPQAASLRRLDVTRGDGAREGSSLAHLTVIEDPPAAGVRGRHDGPPTAASLSDMRDALGRTPLMYAAAAGRWDLARELLDQPPGIAAVPRASDVAGDTAATHALRAGHAAFALELLLWREGAGREGRAAAGAEGASAAAVGGRFCSCGEVTPGAAEPRRVVTRVAVRLRPQGISRGTGSVEGAESETTVSAWTGGPGSVALTERAFTPADLAELQASLSPARPGAAASTGDSPVQLLATSALCQGSTPRDRTAALDILGLLAVAESGAAQPRSPRSTAALAGAGGGGGGQALHVAAAHGSVEGVVALCGLDRVVTWEAAEAAPAEPEHSAGDGGAGELAAASFCAATSSTRASGVCRPAPALLDALPLWSLDASEATGTPALSPRRGRGGGRLPVALAPGALELLDRPEYRAWLGSLGWLPLAAVSSRQEGHPPWTAGCEGLRAALSTRGGVAGLTPREGALRAAAAGVAGAARCADLLLRLELVAEALLLEPEENLSSVQPASPILVELP